MANRHTEVLAEYQDPGSIFAYGWGALSSRFNVFERGLCDVDEFMSKASDIIRAVEDRLAERTVEMNARERGTRQDTRNREFVPMPQLVSEIYQAPQGADGIARDQ